MNYKVLYRKYRPDSFENLIGQDNIVKMLTNSIINNKISHAYIFSGPRGTGKTSSSKIFAKSINCLNSLNGNPCNECLNCLNSETSGDIIEIDAASNNGVDEIREITNNIKLAPNMLKYKVYIVDEVHMLSQSAFNALLLTLEEPPGHVVFILATTNIENVPITILSRCQRFDFKKITQTNIENTIRNTCDAENISITEDAIKEIAYLSDGGLRDCLSILDQLSKENIEITVDLVNNSVGNISSQKINDVIQILENSSKLDLIDKINEYSSQNVDVKLFIKALIDNICMKVKNIVINSEITNFGVKKYKNLVIELTEFINSINVSVDSYSVLLIILLTYITEDSENNLKLTDTNVLNEYNLNIDSVPEAKEEKKVQNSVFDYNSIIKLRINNCFVSVDKEEKNKHLSVWADFVFDSDNIIKGLIMDSSVVAASDLILIIKIERENDIEKIYENLNVIQSKYDKYSKFNVNIVFVTAQMWKKYSEEYIKNMKNGVKYNIIKEEISDELSAIADDIFTKDKIEER